MVRATLAALCLSPFAAFGQSTTLTADPVQSGLDVEACVDPGGGTICENAQGGLMGTITISVDDPEAPTTISIDGLDIANTEPLEIVYDFGFFGSITLVADSFAVVYDGVGPTPPVAIVDGAFTVPMVPVLGTIVGSFSGEGIIGAPVGMGDLNETAPSMSDLTGTLVVDPSTGDYTITLDFAVVQEGEVAGFPFSVDGVGVLVANGPAPEPGVDCPPDLNDDGALTGADFNAFISAFVAGDPRADLNMDGQLTGADFNAFISLFGQGCG